ncbi:putative cell survival pathways protein [Lambiella insularis]|nr:putative cell survival pathways protein [Lambiella insularis]
MNWLKQQVANVAGTQEPIYGPTALRSVAQQAKTTPYTELKKDDLKWVAMGSTCVETQSFYLMADSGHIAMAQVIYSNVAGLRTTCQFNTKVYYPDGKTPNLWSSDPLDNYGFDDAQLCFYADSCAVDLSEDGTFYSIKSATNESSIVNLKVTRKTPGFQVGRDGKSYFGTDPERPWGSMRHAFWPRCDVEAARWNFVNFQSPTYSAVMMEYTTPPSYGSSVVNVGGLTSDNDIICAGSSNSASHLDIKDDPDNEWPEPAVVKYEWSGTSKEGQPVTAELAGNLGIRLDKIDVMAQVPGFVKAIIGGVAGTKPYIYQYAPQQRLKLKLNIGGKETAEEGVLFSEAVFISE